MSPLPTGPPEASSSSPPLGITPASPTVDATAMDKPQDPQQQQTIRITLDDQVAQGEYVNFANIIHSQAEFVLDFGRVVPGRPDVKIYSRIILTPLHAKQLLE